MTTPFHRRTAAANPHTPVPKPLNGAEVAALADLMSRLLGYCDCLDRTTHLHVTRDEQMVLVGLDHGPLCPNLQQSCPDHEATPTAVVLMELTFPMAGRLS